MVTGHLGVNLEEMFGIPVVMFHTFYHYCRSRLSELKIVVVSLAIGTCAVSKSLGSDVPALYSDPSLP